MAEEKREDNLSIIAKELLECNADGVDFVGYDYLYNRDGNFTVHESYTKAQVLSPEFTSYPRSMRAYWILRDGKKIYLDNSRFTEVKARWIYQNGVPGCRCSRCEAFADSESKFCPECGAKMELELSDEEALKEIREFILGTNYEYKDNRTMVKDIRNAVSSMLRRVN